MMVRVWSLNGLGVRLLIVVRVILNLILNYLSLRMLMVRMMGVGCVMGMVRVMMGC